MTSPKYLTTLDDNTKAYITGVVISYFHDLITNIDPLVPDLNLDHIQTSHIKCTLVVDYLTVRTSSERLAGRCLKFLRQHYDHLIHGTKQLMLRDVQLFNVQLEDLIVCFREKGLSVLEQIAMDFHQHYTGYFIERGINIIPSHKNE